MEKYEVLKFKDGEFELDVNVSPEEDTVWLTQEEIALLFGKDRSVITKHINNIFKQNELLEAATRAKFAQVRIEGNRTVERESNFKDIFQSKDSWKPPNSQFILLMIILMTHLMMFLKKVILCIKKQFYTIY